MKNSWKLLSLTLLLGLSVASCGGKDKGNTPSPTPPTPIFPIEEPEEGPAVLTKEVRLYLGETCQFVLPDRLKLSDPIVENSDKEWGFTIDDKTGIITITAPKVMRSKSPSHTIKFTGKVADNQPWSSEVTCTMLDYSNKNGAFLLNEGNVHGNPNEMGSLVYLSAERRAIPNIYYTLNDERYLGHCPQDIYSHNGKYYVISQLQNASTDGNFTIIDAKTLKKESRSELRDLKDPTHLAVVDANHIYVRDAKGVWRVEKTKSTFITSSENAAPRPMVVSQGNLFFIKNNNTLAMVTPSENKVAKEQLFTGATINGLAPAGKNALYVAGYLNGEGFVAKYSSSADMTKLSENKIKEGADVLEKVKHNSSSISAKGDTIYYSGNSMKIYRHLFSQKQSQLMMDVQRDLATTHTIAYGTAQVHPVTGLVYFNTIHSYPEYKTNTTYLFQMRGVKGQLLKSWQNVSRFPAGVFFPATAYE